MNSIRMNEVAARVVAWHNRHPLARRITSAQVGAVGVIALPFVTTAERAGGTVRADLAAPRVVVEPSFGAPPVLDHVVTQDEPAPAAQDGAKASLRERAMAVVAGEQPAPSAPAVAATAEAPQDRGGWLGALRRLLWPRSRAGFEPVFSEDFIAPLRPRQVARWALQHGSTTRPGEPAWPQREVLADPALQSKASGKPGVESVTLYLVTAAIDTPSKRLRVLLGRNGTIKVLGRRDWSLPRLLMGGALLPALLAGAVWLFLAGGEPEAGPEAVHPPPAASAVPASAPTPSPNIAAPAASPVLVIADAPASAPIPAAPVPTAASAAAPAPPASEALADKTRPSRTKPLLSDEARQAAMAEGKQMRASDPLPPARTPRPAASAPAPKPSKAPDPGPLAIPATPQADRGPSDAAQRPPQGGSAPATAKFYALVTKPSFSKVDAEARMVLLRAGAANAIAPAGTRIELIQARQAWQAVWWPFAKRDDAERARNLLAVRGVQVDLVEF